MSPSLPRSSPSSLSLVLSGRRSGLKPKWNHPQFLRKPLLLGAVRLTATDDSLPLQREPAGQVQVIKAFIYLDCPKVGACATQGTFILLRLPVVAKSH